MPHTLILLRHGQSDWNQKNLFTGWVDVRLTEQGKAEATRAGKLLAEHNVLPDVDHTSVFLGRFRQRTWRWIQRIVSGFR